MGINIRLATDADMDAVCRLRQEVHADEMKVRQRHADKTRRLPREPLDHCGEVLVAYDEDGLLVGTARVNLGTKSDFTSSGSAELQQCTRLYRMDEFEPFFPRQVSVRSKLAIRAGSRRGLLAERLLAEGFRLQVEAGMEFDFSDCPAERWPLFERLGYRRVMPEIDHPEEGRTIPVVLVVRDREYLWEVNPRLAFLLPPPSEPPASVRFFYERFPDAPRSLAARSRHNGG